MTIGQFYFFSKIIIFLVQELCFQKTDFNNDIFAVCKQINYSTEIVWFSIIRFFRNNFSDPIEISPISSFNGGADDFANFVRMMRLNEFGLKESNKNIQKCL